MSIERKREMKLSTRRNIKGIAVYATAFLGAFFYGFPIYWMIACSVTPEHELFKYPPRVIRAVFTLENFNEVWTTTMFPNWFQNSAIIAVGVCISVVAIGTLSGYSLTRFKYSIHGTFNLNLSQTYARFTLFAYMFPRIVLAIPVFVIMKNIGLVDTMAAVLIAQLTFSLPHAMWILFIFFQDLPIEPEEAALVDGASRLQALFRVVIPMAAPAMIVTALIAFVHSWNDYIWSLILLQSNYKYTLPLGVSFFMAHQAVEWGSLMASSVLMEIPIFILFIFSQKYLIRGLTAGAVKG